MGTCGRGVCARGTLVFALAGRGAVFEGFAAGALVCCWEGADGAEGEWVAWFGCVGVWCGVMLGVVDVGFVDT